MLHPSAHGAGERIGAERVHGAIEVGVVVKGSVAEVVMKIAVELILRRGMSDRTSRAR